MGTTSPAQRVVLAEGRSIIGALFGAPTILAWDLERGLPYSANRGKKSVNRQALDDLKQQIPLLEYLQAHDWQPGPAPQPRPMDGTVSAARRPQAQLPGGPHKNLFYCYGCGRGGDVIRFAELYHQVRFPQALALLRQWRGVPPLLHEAAVSIACSYTATARRLPICTNAESARRN
jgi:hypothetical protein